MSPYKSREAQKDNCLGFELETGRLEVKVRSSEISFEELCEVGRRYNKKRSFIFVSKVLGKHWPVKPSVMEQTHLALASKVRDFLNGQKGPVLFVAMAETAIGLGRGIFDAFIRLGSEVPSIFTQTTRYNLNKSVALHLDEVHSHARSHLVYYPISEEAMKLLREARVLVLIDDEISTGNTLKNLALAFREISTKVKRVILTSLTNWLPEALQDQLRKELPFEVKFASILEGSFSYFPNQGQLEPPEFNSIGSFQALDHILVNNYGRFALRQDEGAGLIKKAERMANELDLAPNKKIRVIGTGEFLHEPFLLANFLEKKGNYVTFQSTTRTPIAQGQAIKNILRFKDNYFENLDNFLYNLDDNFDGETIIVYETATIPEDHDLPARLGARIVYFS